MKVMVIATGEVAEAKRFKGMSEEEVKSATNDPKLWKGNEIFLEPEDGGGVWRWMPEDEIEIIEDQDGSIKK